MIRTAELSKPCWGKSTERFRTHFPAGKYNTLIQGYAMATRGELLSCLDELLDSSKIKDYCPNGLQVEGKNTVKKLVTGVSASLSFIEAALDSKADALLVHHGYFWKNEPSCISGMKKQRLKRLLVADINLFAYHLPLDLHPNYGNNVQLANVLGLHKAVPLQDEPLMWRGEWPQAGSGEMFARHISQMLQRPPVHIAGSDRPVRTVAWCSGGAQGFIEQAALNGVDAYISGEISEQTVHVAREYGIHFYAAGHHATERYGVQAVGDYLARRFDLEHKYVEIDNPA